MKAVQITQLIQALLILLMQWADYTDARGEGEGLADLSTVFAHCRQYNIRLNPLKCAVEQRRVRCLHGKRREEDGPTFASSVSGEVISQIFIKARKRSVAGDVFCYSLLQRLGEGIHLLLLSEPLEMAKLQCAGKLSPAIAKADEDFTSHKSSGGRGRRRRRRR